MGIKTLNSLLDSRRDMKTAQQVMEARRAAEGTKGLAESMEIHELKERIYLLERKVREQERELNDYRNREQELLDEIEELRQNQRYSSSPLKTSHTVTTPRFILGFDMGTEVTKGLAEKWEAFMYAYTDPVFVESDKPDLLLYDNGLAYTNPNGTVSLGFPVTQESLDRYGILSVRPLTDEELDDIVHKYNLIA